ncbi:MAG: hypothetical protein LBT38_01400 [Deltaproteobacteria bacterium]|jgi:hypothetical protein|nr:hypothetical protein [Deltaproteobacteria bacterium]
MSQKPPALDLTQLRLSSLATRPSKVTSADFVKTYKVGQGFREFAQGLPNILAAGDLKKAAGYLAKSIAAGRTNMLAMGGHAIKVGLGPLMVDLLEKGFFSCLAANGSVMVHDTEVALAGATSEDVGEGLKDGQFGVTNETGALINQAARVAAQTGEGLGEALGRVLNELKPKGLKNSVLAAAQRLGVPFAIQVALGTDVYHIHPDRDFAALGRAGQRDFEIFCQWVATLAGGVFMNLGSAVIMPEVFLKAVTLARNLGYPLDDLTTINMDFIYQYRPRLNVVERPTKDSGRGFYFIGHHEIMFPLLMGLVLEDLANPADFI